MPCNPDDLKIVPLFVLLNDDERAARSRGFRFSTAARCLSPRRSHYSLDPGAGSRVEDRQWKRL
jgi:hypothetical protein